MELTIQEKKAIINQYLKTIVSNIYSYNINLISENSVANPDQQAITNINNAILKEEAKKEALLAEYASLDSEG